MITAALIILFFRPWAELPEPPTRLRPPHNIYVPRRNRRMLPPF